MPRPRPYKSTPYKSPYRPSYQAASRPSRPARYFGPRANTGEMKYFDTELDNTAIATSTAWTGTELPPNVGTPNTLVCPTVGSAINQRVGRRIRLYKLSVKGLLYTFPQAAQTAGDLQGVVRLALVQDMQTNGSQAQGEEIFQAPVTAAALQCISSFQSLATLGRFKVWKDKTILMGDPNMVYTGANNADVNGTTRPFKMNLKFSKPIEINFNATNGGTIADIVDNSFCVYATNGDTSAQVLMTYQARAYYKEL